MQQYLDLVNRGLTEGRLSDNRTGVKTLALFGANLTFDLAEGFPLLTTKKVNLKAIINELLWFVAGHTNIKDPELGGSTIWDEWAVKQSDVAGVMSLAPIYRAVAKKADVDQEQVERVYRDQPHEADAIWAVRKTIGSFGLDPDTVINECRNELVGSIGPMYGAQWRNFNGVDQLAEVLRNLRDKPLSRRHVVSAWNPSALPNESVAPELNVIMGKGALAPCHCFFQFDVEKLTPEEQAAVGGKEYRLNCLFYMRSSDIGLGLPFNIGSYAALTLAICNQLDYAPGKLCYSGGNVHIYENHIEGLKEQLTRPPRQLPQLRINRATGTSIFDLTAEDFVLEDYDPYLAIKLPIAK